MNKIRKKQDATLERNNQKYFLHLIKEYESIKQKTHTRFKFVSEFYRCYSIKRQNFIKYYNRYKFSGNADRLLPQKRGPRYKFKRIAPFIENKVIELRNQGFNRYKIFSILKPKYDKFTPCPTTIYNLSKKHGINRLTPKQMTNKRKIIKQKAGELGHIDCHYLPPSLIQNDTRRYYLVGIIDDATRVVWAEVIDDIKALTVMFASLKILNLMHQ